MWGDRRGLGLGARGALLLVGVVLQGAALAHSASASAALILQVVGTGTAGYSGDGGSARDAQINHPRGLALTPDGGYLVADAFGDVVRKVSASGVITTVAGNATEGFSGDGGPATSASLHYPHAVAALPDGGFLIDDELNERIRRVSPSGTITTVAGTGTRGFSGDGGPATSAQIDDSRGLASLADGSFLIADSSNGRIRYVNTSGIISTVAGTGIPADSVAGVPQCSLSGQLAKDALMFPYGVAPLPDGGFLVADFGDNCVRKVSSLDPATSTITTLAGGGMRGYSGDGGPAVAATLNQPHNSTPLPDGGFLIADTYNHRIRRVFADGTIDTFAGSGIAGAAGVGGPPRSVQLNYPKAVLPYNGQFLIADSYNSRILSLDPFATPPGPPNPIPPPRPTPAPTPQVSVARGDMALYRDRALIDLRCTSAAGEACTGRLFVRVKIPGAHGRPMSLRLGATNFHIAGGKTRSVSLRLSRSNRRRFAALSRAQLRRVQAIATLVMGGRSTAVALVTRRNTRP